MPSLEPTPRRLRPEHASDRRQVLVGAAPALSGGAAPPRVDIPPTAAPRDLAYATALVAACQRMWAASDVALLWRTIVDEAMALIPADGAALITYTEGFWQTLAARPDDAAPDDLAVAVATEALFRRGLLRQPISIDDLAEGAWSVGLGWRALLVERLDGSPRQPVRLVWYATRPASLSPYADIAEAFAHHASLAVVAASERENLTRAIAARHRVGLAQGILMIRRRLTADQAFALLQHESQNTHVKLRTIAQTVIQTGDLPVGSQHDAG
jgi:ANTAR domain